MEPRFEITPESPVLMDEEISICVHGLPPNEPITIESYIHYDKVKFLGAAHFYASATGIVDVTAQPSMGGTYRGIEPMGLFSTMRAWPSRHATARLIASNVTKPFYFELVAWRGHQSMDDLMALRCRDAILGTDPRFPLFQQVYLTKAEVVRTYLHPDVQRIPLKGDASGVRGMFFVPPGKGPFRGIIDMFGGYGGCVELRAALLAKHGYATLALAYMNYEDLKPKDVMQFRMEYFDKAVEWLQCRPEVAKGGIGVVGVCQGAHIAAMMLQRNANIKAAVLMNPPYLVMCDPESSNPWMWFWIKAIDGSVTVDQWGLYHFEDGVCKVRPGRTMKLDFPPVKYKHTTKILLIASENDGSVDQPKNAQLMQEHFSKYGKGQDLEVLVVPGVGHLLEPPYNPPCRITQPVAHYEEVPGGQYLSCLMMYGGEYEDHGKNSKFAWDKLLDFLSRNLQDRPQAKL